ncbi:MAG: TetR/AcrR family transcriptional regulator [Lachnospiraceae bacterium]|nr:TetR/AcrR family transcriptional regulator [Lachnospiraceae bacterium]
MITNRILKEEGIGGVNIRRVAKEAGCTSAVLYKHFENREHLIMLASVKFLEPYILEFQKQIRRTDISSIQMDLILWRLFISEAFMNKPYYELMFFGPEREKLEECVYEYYQLFPEYARRFDGLGASIIFNSNISNRELIRLRRAANEGLITLENAEILSRLSSAVFQGMFMQYPYTEMKENPASLKLATEDCFHLIFELFRKFVKPGTVLDIDS